MMDELDDQFYVSSVESSPPSKRAELRLSEDISDDLLLDGSSEDLTTQTNDPLIKNIETIEYSQLEYHWFYTSFLPDKKIIWLPFSFNDTSRLEEVYKKNIEEIKQLRSQPENKRVTKNYTISVKGGRFEVDLIELLKGPVYWTEDKTSNVRRCLWFYKESNDTRFVPYEEEYSEFLEIEYEKTIKKNTFHKRIDYQSTFNKNNAISTNKLTKQYSIGNEEAFVFHSPKIMLHFTQATMLDEFGNLNSDAKRPRVVKRSVLEVVDKVENDEIDKIDHLVFVVHGIGEACDMKFRPIVECVDDFRTIGCDIAQSHLKTYIDSSQINGRVEFLPIAWHQDLHGNKTGIDERLKPLSLTSIPKLREFSNTTVLDVLFYTSPIYCQTIINRVGNELNTLSERFKERNPDFKGTISLVGHSLGSLICFDLLSNQFEKDLDPTNISKSNTKTSMNDIELSAGSFDDFLNRLSLNEYKEVFDKEKIDLKNLSLVTENDLCQMGLPIGLRRVLLNEIRISAFQKEKNELTKEIESNLSKMTDTFDLKNGLAGTGQIMVKFPKLNFNVAKFFALGSPISMFQTVRGVENINPEFKFPNCEEFYNIFHPFDPIAYRFEPLICTNPVLKPVLMPHHKGRKRMHIELREGLSKVGEDMVKVGGEFLKNAWTTFNDTQSFFKKLPKPSLPNSIEGAEKKAESIDLTSQQKISSSLNNTVNPPLNRTRIKSESGKTDSDSKKEKIEDESMCNFGRINKGKRIDYVLQETPFESFNDYLFAVASHTCYWESEDTLLHIVKQLYGYEDEITDANVELGTLTESQRQQTSWITQVAAQTLSSNVQKTFEYFQMGIPQSLTNVLPSTSNLKK